MSTYYKGYKVQLNPTEEQEKLLWRFAGARRFTWNYFLHFQKITYELTKKYKTLTELNKLFTELRDGTDFPWLKNISRRCCEGAIKDLDKVIWKAKKGNYPKFKSRKELKQQFYPCDGNRVSIKNDSFRVTNIGYIKLKETDHIPVFITRKEQKGKYFNPRISYDGINWYLSICIKCETQAFNKNTTEPLGIDVGINNLITLSNGKTFEYPKNLLSRSKILDRRIRRLQSLIDQEKHKMKNIYGSVEDKDKSKELLHLEFLLRKTYRREARIRHDFIHKLTTKIIQLNPEKIVIEDLNVASMYKNKPSRFRRRLAKSLIGEILRQLEYKAMWNEIPLVKADRYYPSSKLCSSCGCKSLILTPFDKTFCCPVCNYTEHRDINAAHNLVVYDPSLRGNP